MSPSKNARESEAGGKKARSEASREIKILWGLAAGRCAFPECRAVCVESATAADGPVVLGKAAHIAAHSNGGPRFDPNLPAADRGKYGNLILLCAKHHDIVDGQPNTYTVDALRTLKSEHEAWVRLRLTEEMPEVGFAELEIVTKGILAAPLQSSGRFQLTEITEKMKKNGLSPQMNMYFTIGLSKAREVELFVDGLAQVSPSFPDALKAGFVKKYDELWASGLRGDQLFQGLQDFASGGSRDLRRIATGLAVLLYLFEKCEVFES